MGSARQKTEGATTAALALGGVCAAGLATAAGACCAPIIAPTLVAVLGASGAAWAAGFGPWAGRILAASGVLIALAHWRLGRAAIAGPSCARRMPKKAIATVWIATLVWIVALFLQLWAASAGAKV